jgi:hydroxylamine dehydrogenase
VACPDCHGADHQKLRMPTPKVCAECHAVQHDAFQSEKQYGFPSHVLAMERATDSKHFADKPKAETTACVQCHSVATKCDSCHTRHRFDAAEARRAEACTTCHSGPPHPDDEAFYGSAARQALPRRRRDDRLEQAAAKGQLHGTDLRLLPHAQRPARRRRQVDLAIRPAPGESEHRGEQGQARALDRGLHRLPRRGLFAPATERAGPRARARLAGAQSHGTSAARPAQRKAFYPAAGERPPYPTDWMERWWPKERIGFFEGQASSFYNVSPIERDYFEMWYFANLGAYKASAHGAPALVEEGHARLCNRPKPASPPGGEPARPYRQGRGPTRARLWTRGRIHGAQPGTTDARPAACSC